MHYLIIANAHFFLVLIVTWSIDENTLVTLSPLIHVHEKKPIKSNYQNVHHPTGECFY